MFKQIVHQLTTYAALDIAHGGLDGERDYRYSREPWDLVGV